jgi:preprotein translocase subunit SecE
MPQVSSRPSQDEDEVIEGQAEGTESDIPTDAMSDKRKRQLQKRGKPAVAVISSEDVGESDISDKRRRQIEKRGEPAKAVISADDADDDDDEVEVERKGKETPSTREVHKSPNVVVRFGQNIIEYMRETRDELRKVTWLTREQTMRLTYIVLIVTAAASAFLGIVGFVFGLLTQALASQSTTLVAGFFLAVLIIVVTAGWLFRERLFGGHFE